jgi:hypothetical protein
MNKLGLRAHSQGFERRERVDNFLRGHYGVDVVCEVDAPSSVHVLIREIRGRVSSQSHSGPAQRFERCPDLFDQGFRRGCRRSDQFDRDVHVAANRFGICANLLRSVHHLLSYAAVQPWHADVEPSLQKVIFAGLTQIYFGVERCFLGKPDLHLASCDFHRLFEAAVISG